MLPPDSFFLSAGGSARSTSKVIGVAGFQGVHTHKPLAKMTISGQLDGGEGDGESGFGEKGNEEEGGGAWDGEHLDGNRVII